MKPACLLEASAVPLFLGMWGRKQQKQELLGKEIPGEDYVFNVTMDEVHV